MHCHALQKKVNQGNSVCSLLSFLPFWSDAEFFNVPLFDMKIPRETDSFSSRWCYAMCVWPLKGNSHHPHFYSRLLDSHNEVSFEVSFLGEGLSSEGEGNVSLEKKKNLKNEASLWTKDKQDLRRFKKDF